MSTPSSNEHHNTSAVLFVKSDPPILFHMWQVTYNRRIAAIFTRANGAPCFQMDQSNIDSKLIETTTIRLPSSPGCKNTEQKIAIIWKFHAIDRQYTLNNLYKTYSTN